MSRVIWKYEIETGAAKSIPVGAQFLSVQSQNDNVCAWYLVNPEEKEKELIDFYIINTGRYINTDDLKKMEFLGTVQTRQGVFVWHVFSSKRS